MNWKSWGAVFIGWALAGGSWAANAETRYPLVLAHGLLGSDGLMSLNRAADWLKKDGEQVFVTEVNAAASIAARGVSLARQIDQILEQTGAAKVNLIGHSMGGLDSRFVITKLGYGDRIASLTTLSTPHFGSSFAELLSDGLANNQGGKIKAMVELWATLYNDATNLDNVDLEAALKDLRPDAMAKFNREVPDDPRVRYFSVGAAATPLAMHYVLLPFYYHTDQAEGPNDGLVSLASAKWGEYLGSVQADHFTMAGIGRWDLTWRFTGRQLFQGIAAAITAAGY